MPDDSVAHSSLPVPAAAAAHYAGVARADLRAGGRRRRRCGVPVGDPGRRRFPTGYALGAGPIAGWGRGHPRDLHPGAGAAGCHRRRPDRRRVRRTGRLRCGRIVLVFRIVDRFRDLIVLQSVPDAASRGVVDAPEDALDRMREQAARIGRATLTRYAEVVQAGLGEMRGATAPRLLLEVVCARLLLPSASDAESALLQRVERIETRLDMSIPAPQAVPRPSAAAAEPKHQPAREPRPVLAPTPASSEPTVAAVRSMWPTVRDKVRLRSRTTEVMLAGATVRALEDNTLVLTHESAPLARRLSEQRNADVLAEALKDALGVNWRVRCETGEPAAAASPVGGGANVATAKAVNPAPTANSTQRDEEEHMLAEAGRGDPSPRRDPEEVALELLQNELGARRIDNA
ncbi:DNA polymerase III gamma/tau subunit dnaZ/X [Mycobacterium tuberculosis T92]|nr:DNA polymerase III gamma/tau subunit dnaZ/X [Mycobacterium tuberculosis T92]